MSEVSQLRVYSLAIVGANKKLDSKDIECVPLEDSPMTNGELTDSVSEVSSKASDVEGGAYETATPTSATVQATWLPIHNSNRMTAPDVRRGETVVLYRFADQDKFWWNTLKNDMDMRKLETVVFAISATKEESAKSDAKNTYFFEWSSHKKLLHLHTSKADGEPYAYDIQINTKDGFITIQDDDGQRISMDSTNRQLVMTNRDGSLLDINKTKMRLHADDEILITTKSYILQADTIDSSASSSAVHKTPTNTIEAQTTHKGNIALRGGFTAGGLSGGGTTMTVQGNIRTTDDVVAGGISLIDHTHDGDSGGQTSKPKA